MQAFADADHVSDPIDRKSIRGYYLHFLVVRFILIAQNRDLLLVLQ